MKLFKLGNFYQYSIDWALFVFSQNFSIKMDAISRHIIPRIDDLRHSYQCCRSRFGKQETNLSELLIKIKFDRYWLYFKI